jgi:hypothetical protein
MIDHAHPTPPSAAAFADADADAPASSTLELLEARKLRDSLKVLLRREQAAMAEFLIALADFDRRRGWEPLGHASLFAFLHVELQLSRSATFWRLSAARLLQRFPEVVEPLRDGRLCLTTTAELAKVLTEQNMAQVLPRYFHLSSREAAEVTAALQPREQPPLRTVVSLLDPEQRAVVNATAPAEPAGALILVPAPVEPSAPTRTLGLVLAPEPALTQPARVHPRYDQVEPLTADLRRLHVTVSRQFLASLDAARDGLSNAIPGATTEQVLQAALDSLLEKQARARAQVKRPRKTIAAAKVPTSTTSPDATVPPIPGTSRATVDAQSSPSPSVAPPGGRATGRGIRREGHREAIPAAVCRAVWARDGGRCAWPLDGGGRCGSTHRLQLDHILPWARGGSSTVDNLRITCAQHNGLAARRVFGERWMRRYAGRTSGLPG